MCNETIQAQIILLRRLGYAVGPISTSDGVVNPITVTRLQPSPEVKAPLLDPNIHTPRHTGVSVHLVEMPNGEIVEWHVWDLDAPLIYVDEGETGDV